MYDNVHTEWSEHALEGIRYDIICITGWHGQDIIVMDGQYIFGIFYFPRDIQNLQ